MATFVSVRNCRVSVKLLKSDKTLCFVLYKAVSDTFPGSKLFIEHPLSLFGFYLFGG